VSLHGGNHPLSTSPVTAEVRLDGEHVLLWRTTPWDAAVFGHPTGEILSIGYTDPGRLPALLALFSAERRRAGLRLCVTRVPADDRDLRRALMESGFVQVETALRMVHTRVGRPVGKPPFADNLKIEEPVPSDEQALVAIGRDAFNYSRFHEDPFVDINLARRRYQRWIEDLLRQKTPLWVHRGEAGVDAFVAFAREGSAVELILAGSAADRGFLSPGFFASFIRQFREEGVRRAAATISAANRAVLDIYAQLGFRTEQTLFGYHLHGTEKE
jgi:hypothetical protein